jgi:hypothetical protein
MRIGAWIGAGIGTVMSVLYLQSNFWSHYFFTTALDSLLLIGAVLLAWLVLGLMSLLLSARFLPWLKAKRQAAHWRICQKDYHRFRLGSGLPWPVRWSGRLLMVEEPRQHEDFADYFVCRYCGDHTEFVTARCVIGVIGAMPSAAVPDELNISLFDPASRQARSADIDRLDLYPPPPGQTLDYDYAVNAVLNDPEPAVLVDSLGRSTVNLRVYFWLNGHENSWLKVRSSVIRLVKLAFQQQGISMPDEAREVVFPQGISPSPCSTRHRPMRSVRCRKNDARRNRRPKISLRCPRKRKPASIVRPSSLRNRPGRRNP